VTPPSPSSPAPSPKSVLIPAKITASFAEIQELATEKCALAERLIEIISRTRSKLDVDIAKVRTLQGEPPELVAATVGKPLATHPTLVAAESLSLPGSMRNLNPAYAIGESLRNALGVPPSELKAALSAASPGATPSAGHATKSMPSLLFISSISLTTPFAFRTPRHTDYIHQDFSCCFTHETSFRIPNDSNGLSIAYAAQVTPFTAGTSSYGGRGQ
jgi:hypothetical protein